MLGDIFTETPDAPVNNVAQAGPLTGLDDRHTNLVRKLIDKVTWTEEEMQSLCNELGLMISGAIETINEWAFEIYDEALVDEYNGFEVTTDIAEQIIVKLAEESL